MNVLRKSKLSVMAVTVAAVTGMLGFSGTASAVNNPTDFSAVINVSSTNTCELDVTPPADTTFTANWVANIVSGTATLTNTTTDTNPHYINVVATGGTSCSLNGITVTTTANGAVLSSQGIPAMSFGGNGGFWKYIPILARAQFFTDNAFATPATGTITAVLAAHSMTYQNTVKNPAGTSLTASWFGSGLSGKHTQLTDSYQAGSTEAARLGLINNNLSHQSSFTSSVATEVYKSARLGIGAIVSEAPVNSSGVTSLTTAVDGDVVTMPFTVVVTSA